MSQRNFSLCGILFTTILGLMAPLPAAADVAPADDPAALDLRVGIIRPEISTSLHRRLIAGTPQAREAAAAAQAVARWTVVQLDGPLTPQRAAALAQQGVTLGQYLPNNAFLTKLPAGFDPAARLGNTNFVRWVGAYDKQWKLDPEIGKRPLATDEFLQLDAQGLIPLVVTLFEFEGPESALAAVQALPDATVNYVENVGGNETMYVVIRKQDVAALADIATVQFVEPAPEITFRNSTNRWIVQSNVTNVTPFYNAGIHGEGQLVGIMDGRIDINHCSFLDSVNPVGALHRKIQFYGTTLGSDSHGTHVAGTAAGDAGANNDTRGVAYAARICYNTTTFSETTVDTRLTQFHNNGARVHTNSWGNDGTTVYDGLCRGIDTFSYAKEDSLVMFAVTNLSTLKNPENAKNVLAVGASQDTPSQANFCSGGTGPTADGRRKPEIYAPGCNTQSSRWSTTCSTVGSTGTSMASPAVAGTAMLVRQYYTDGFYPSGAANPSDAITPSGALVKATLLNSAVDMTGISGFPSNQEGWGRVLADNGCYFAGDARRLVVLADKRNADGLSTGQIDEYTISVNDGAQSLKVTLVFTEPAATAGASNPVINNLSLEVVAPDASSYKGNNFSSGQSVAGGIYDAKNNVEQVLRNTPATGAYTVRVRAESVNSGLQGYALIATGGVFVQSLTVEVPAEPLALEDSLPTVFGVVITPFGETIVPGSPMLHYRFDGGAYLSTPLTFVSGNDYLATLPPAGCTDTPEFYVSAEGSLGSIVTDPPDAPGSGVFSAVVGHVEAESDDLDFGPAAALWTPGAVDDTATAGIWERVNPVGTTAQPEDDHTLAGTMAFVTGQGLIGGGEDDADVDGGRTTLTTPVIDLTNVTTATISYWRWYSNSAGANPGEDTLLVEITDDGIKWVEVETVGPTGPDTSGGWIQHTFDPLTLVNPTNQVRMRFVASDLLGDSRIEAAIDDLQADLLRCPEYPCLKADMDASGVVDADDVQRFVDILLAGGSSRAERCAGDTFMPHDDQITTADVASFVQCVLDGGCL